MHFRFLQFSLVFLTAAAGCHCPSTRHGPAISGTPAFVEWEVRAKSWTDWQGHTIKLLDWSETNSKVCGEIVVAKFGDTNTGLVTCLEFYGVRRWEESYMPVLEMPGRPLSDPKLIPTGAFFVLLARAYSSNMVVSVNPAYHREMLGFSITRETIPGTTRPRMRYESAIFFDKDWVKHDGFSHFVSEIRD